MISFCHMAHSTMEHVPTNSPWRKLELLDLGEHLWVLIAKVGNLLVLDPVDRTLGVWVALCMLDGGTIEVDDSTHKRRGVPELVVDSCTTMGPLTAAVQASKNLILGGLVKIYDFETDIWCRDAKVADEGSRGLTDLIRGKRIQGVGYCSGHDVSEYIGAQCGRRWQTRAVRCKSWEKNEVEQV